MSLTGKQCLAVVFLRCAMKLFLKSSFLQLKRTMSWILHWIYTILMIADTLGLPAQCLLYSFVSGEGDHDLNRRHDSFRGFIYSMYMKPPHACSCQELESSLNNKIVSRC